jgi:hypothetical protein
VKSRSILDLLNMKLCTSIDERSCEWKLHGRISNEGSTVERSTTRAFILIGGGLGAVKGPFPGARNLAKRRAGSLGRGVSLKGGARHGALEGEGPASPTLRRSGERKWHSSRIHEARSLGSRKRGHFQPSGLLYAPTRYYWKGIL